MVLIVDQSLSEETRRSIFEANKRVEQVEVILSNLLALRHPEEDKFLITHDEVVVSIETALHLLVLGVIDSKVF